MTFNELMKAAQEWGRENGYKVALTVTPDVQPAYAGAVASGWASEHLVTYDAWLMDYGKSRVHTIRAIRRLLGCDLFTAKNMIENMPCVLKEDCGPDEIQRIQSIFEDAKYEGVTPTLDLREHGRGQP